MCLCHGKTQDMEYCRNEFLSYIGGQTNAQCSDHQLPLIVTRNSHDKCYMSVNGTINNHCNNKMHLGCPVLLCKCVICRKCLTNIGEVDHIHLIDPPVVDIIDQSSSSSELSMSSDNTDMSEGIYDDLDLDELIANSENSFCELSDLNALVAPIGTDALDDCVFLGEDDEMSLEEIVVEDFPSTLAGDSDLIVQEDLPKGICVSGHTIMNLCGSLLNRKDNDIISYRFQKHYLQRASSTRCEVSVPLLYPETMLFPSIFYSMVPKCGSMYGSIPSGLLVESGRNRFASLLSHIKCIIRHAGSSTSTNPSYLSWSYDLLTNLSLCREDSMIVLNRGLQASTKETCLQIRGREDSLLSDSVDNKQTVRNLCASQIYHKMDLFLTFTCNQKEHFGMSMIKRWIDGQLWEQYFPNFETFRSDEQSEVRRGIHQSASGLLLQNWMEVRKIFIQYLYSSPSSPFHPAEEIFLVMNTNLMLEIFLTCT